MTRKICLALVFLFGLGISAAQAGTEKRGGDKPPEKGPPPRIVITLDPAEPGAEDDPTLNPVCPVMDCARACCRYFGMGFGGCVAPRECWCEELCLVVGPTTSTGPTQTACSANPFQPGEAAASTAISPFAKP